MTIETPTSPTGARHDDVVRVEGLEVSFNTDAGVVPVVQDISFSVKSGEMMGLVGESGSGKTVTSLALLGLIPNPPGRVTKGSIHVAGKDLLAATPKEISRLRGETISMVFQEPMTSLNPVFKVGDQLAEVYRLHRKVSRKDAWARAVEMLDRVQIPNAKRRAHSYPHEMSGGMRQRVMIALALICEPSVLVADEPTTALDVTIQAQILELLAELRQDFGMAVILVTHDLSVVAEVCERVVVMYSGQIVESAPIDEVFARPRHPYTSALMKSIPVVGRRTDGPLPFIPGTVAMPGHYPTGCRFGPRCAHFTEACARPEIEDPAGTIRLRDVDVGHVSRCARTDELDLRSTR